MSSPSEQVGFAASTTEAVEAAFKADTVGLQTREQFAEKRANIEKELAREKEQRQLAAEDSELRQLAKRRAVKKVESCKLSFADEEEEAADEEEAAARPLKYTTVGKDPTVETGFLPDRDRDREERIERERLKAAWLEAQERAKNECLEITYSYWDGAGHRKKVVVKKGDTIGAFLKAVREQNAAEFRELKMTTADNMLYIKEDLIMPHSLTFHELIVSKARGKSGPLFHFDVHDDVRMQGDARVEKDESHAGKVVERHWFDKNKHIFPASRWEVYDPTKDYGGYTVHGAEVNEKK